MEVCARLKKISERSTTMRHPHYFQDRTNERDMKRMKLHFQHFGARTLCINVLITFQKPIGKKIPKYFNKFLGNSFVNKSL